MGPSFSFVISLAGPQTLADVFLVTRDAAVASPPVSQDWIAPLPDSADPPWAVLWSRAADFVTAREDRVAALSADFDTLTYRETAGNAQAAFWQRRRLFWSLSYRAGALTARGNPPAAADLSAKLGAPLALIGAETGLKIDGGAVTGATQYFPLIEKPRSGLLARVLGRG
ncbi:MAG: hypothetical protein AAF748_12920 [Pseudomonadota bacterium]